RHRLDGRLRIGEVEEELGGIAHVPDHLEADVDDVLVAGQHQPVAGAAHCAGANLARVLAGHGDDVASHDRPGREVQARLPDAVAAAFTEGQLDRLLLGTHRIEGHHEPQAHGHQRDQPDAARTKIAAAAARAAAPAAAPAAATHKDLQLLL